MYFNRLVDPLHLLMNFSLGAPLGPVHLSTTWPLNVVLKPSTYDFSILYTMLPNHLIKNKLIDLTERLFSREHEFYLTCNEECPLFHLR